MPRNNISNNIAVILAGVFLLAVLLGACAGGGSQPTATEAPVEPTSPPSGAPSTAYPLPGGSLPYPYPTIESPYPGAPQPYPGPVQPYPAPWQPQASDQSLQRGQAFVEQTDILVMESFPPQYALTLGGTLPTPCHQLRVEVAPPDDQNVIQVDAYSVVDPSAICTQVLSPFQANVPLQGLTSGKYTVVVNGQEAGSIEVP